MTLKTARDIGLLIKSKRLDLGLDQATLAKKAGVSRIWIVAMEAGKDNASLALVLRTLNALGVVLTADARTAQTGAPQIDLDAIIAAAKAPRIVRKS
ncbi:MAG TPA: transcriptional regulator [Alphaproteobacteria bacterium]|nr:transcriptional regulator [Alphaproteobacteria bacterium]HAJ45755.1 transcriptional regulator [Alphaproteobacteria bacterium]